VKRLLPAIAVPFMAAAARYWITIQLPAMAGKQKK
jgi:hypothetical protein